MKGVLILVACIEAISALNITGTITGGEAPMRFPGENYTTVEPDLPGTISTNVPYEARSQEDPKLIGDFPPYLYNNDSYSPPILPIENPKHDHQNPPYIISKFPSYTSPGYDRFDDFSEDHLVNSVSKMRYILEKLVQNFHASNPLFPSFEDLSEIIRRPSDYKVVCSCDESSLLSEILGHCHPCFIHNVYIYLELAARHFYNYIQVLKEDQEFPDRLHRLH